jgi:hypothetical protein
MPRAGIVVDVPGQLDQERPEHEQASDRTGDRERDIPGERYPDSQWVSRQSRSPIRQGSDLWLGPEKYGRVRAMDRILISMAGQQGSGGQGLTA